jgi:hypothetical protein
MFHGHDWRTAIGPRDGYFERCRRCYSTRLIDQSHQNGHTHSVSSERAA